MADDGSDAAPTRQRRKQRRQKQRPVAVTAPHDSDAEADTQPLRSPRSSVACSDSDAGTLVSESALPPDDLLRAAVFEAVCSRLCDAGDGEVSLKLVRKRLQTQFGVPLGRVRGKLQSWAVAAVAARQAHVELTSRGLWEAAAREMREEEPDGPRSEDEGPHRVLKTTPCELWVSAAGDPPADFGVTVLCSRLQQAAPPKGVLLVLPLADSDAAEDVWRVLLPRVAEVAAEVERGLAEGRRVCVRSETGRTAAVVAAVLLLMRTHAGDVTAAERTLRYVGARTGRRTDDFGNLCDDFAADLRRRAVGRRALTPPAAGISAAPADQPTAPNAFESDPLQESSCCDAALSGLYMPSIEQPPGSGADNWADLRAAPLHVDSAAVSVEWRGGRSHSVRDVAWAAPVLSFSLTVGTRCFEVRASARSGAGGDVLDAVLRVTKGATGPVSHHSTTAELRRSRVATSAGDVSPVDVLPSPSPAPPAPPPQVLPGGSQRRWRPLCVCGGAVVVAAAMAGGLYCALQAVAEPTSEVSRCQPPITAVDVCSPAQCDGCFAAALTVPVALHVAPSAGDQLQYRTTCSLDGGVYRGTDDADAAVRCSLKWEALRRRAMEAPRYELRAAADCSAGPLLRQLNDTPDVCLAECGARWDCSAVVYDVGVAVCSLSGGVADVCVNASGSNSYLRRQGPAVDENTVPCVPFGGVCERGVALPPSTSITWWLLVAAAALVAVVALSATVTIACGGARLCRKPARGRRRHQYLAEESAGQ
eukprot:TRINITY_DN5449_c0_g1_i2.p1 TRINITY_DN5449_c0_g1~~TRINITY_DN5449_c0_g1_i2.p1  ORF type:complete len:785 (+),score=259.65 TRINITY_DN5449_c0_g1_i2:74-2356(+)